MDELKREVAKLPIKKVQQESVLVLVSLTVSKTTVCLRQPKGPSKDRDFAPKPAYPVTSLAFLLPQS